MKATINGVTVEGTPEEVFDLMCRMGDAGSPRNRKPQDHAGTGQAPNTGPNVAYDAVPAQKKDYVMT